MNEAAAHTPHDAAACRHCIEGRHSPINVLRRNPRRCGRRKIARAVGAPMFCAPRGTTP